MLKSGLTDQHWTPQGSGILINPEYIDKIEQLWFNTITDNTGSSYTTTEFTEGKTTQVTQTRYERNPHARKQCLEHNGYDCDVCEMNFEDVYGQIGRNVIHVHHLIEISQRKGEYKIDPIKDLRPVCPNCHTMLHKRNPSFTIDELKMIITK